MWTKGRKAGQKQERIERWRSARCGQTQEVRVEFQKCSLFTEMLPFLPAEPQQDGQQPLSPGRTAPARAEGLKTDTKPGSPVQFGAGPGGRMTRVPVQTQEQMR